MAPFIASYFPDPERVVMGISELLINAVEHGNLGISYDEKTHLNATGTWEEEVLKRQKHPQNINKKVKAIYNRSPDVVTLNIINEGAGFNWENYLEISPGRATDNHGRGIAMSRLMSFDHLEYRAPSNEVVCKIYHKEKN